MSLENAIHRDMGIKYANARELVGEAKDNLGVQDSYIADSREDVREEVMTIWNSLSFEDKTAMRMEESEWRSVQEAPAAADPDELAQKLAMRREKEEEELEAPEDEVDEEPSVPEAAPEHATTTSHTVLPPHPKTVRRTKTTRKYAGTEYDVKCTCAIL